MNSSDPLDLAALRSLGWQLASLAARQSAFSPKEPEATKEESVPQDSPKLLFTYEELQSAGTLSYSLDALISWAVAGGLASAQAHEISTRWIHNANAHLISERGSAFRELVVNALDAVRKGGSTGKFGMGFFAALQFLNGERSTPCTIEIRTSYTHEQKVRSYVILLKADRTGKIEVTFKATEPTKVGTCLWLLPRKGASFSAKELKEIKKAVGYLQFYEHGRIHLRMTRKEETLVGTKGGDGKVFVLLTPKLLEVSDHGCGIPIEVALTRLLVPSASTKSVPLAAPSFERESQPAQFVRFKAKNRKDLSYFVITVGCVF